ncbi:MAG: hypothetical protein ACREGA_03260 [Candidatus Saccharimonadales bacterium]
MATSSNPKIQKLIDEVETIAGDDQDLETKLNQIAAQMAAIQNRCKTASGDWLDQPNLIDPGEAFACEGCQ